MKDKLIETVEVLREQGVNIKETPPLFNWSYPELPDVLFQLMISEKDITNLH